MKAIKHFILLGIILLGINSQAQISFLGKTLNQVRISYDSVVYDVTDTLAVINTEGECINYIAINDTIDHAIKVLPLNKKGAITESLKTMIESNGKYFFDYNEGLYCMYILELMDNEYFGLYLRRIE